MLKDNDEPINLADLINNASILQNTENYLIISKNRYQDLIAKELELTYMQILDDIANNNYSTNIKLHIEDLEKNI